MPRTCAGPSPGHLPLRLAVLVLGASLQTGCYYGHLASGQLRLLWGREPVAEVIADPETPDAIVLRLERVQQVLAFAPRVGLETGRQYTSYVDWPGDRIVTTVVATPPGSIEPHLFWFPVIGYAPYKGFFELEAAEREAERLARDGLETCLLPVPAYSTLGWLDDPLTRPMLRPSPERVAQTVLHELVHATVFAPDAPDFNEGLATFVGQEAAIRFEALREPSGADGERLRVREDREVARVLRGFRAEVAALYAESPDAGERASERHALEARTREILANLRLETRDASQLAERVRLADPCQALAGAYQGDLPRYERRLEELGGDLRALLEAAGRAAEQEDPRAALLGPTEPEP